MIAWRVRPATLRWALCFLLLAASSQAAFARSAEPKDDPPPGITHTTATLNQVLTANDAAAGHLQKAGAVRTEVWQFTKAGEQGTERLVRRGTDYHSVIQTGPFTEEYGQSGDARWHMNENGAVTDMSGTEWSSFEMFRVLQDASDPKNDVKLLGEVTEPQPAYVIEVKRPWTKHPEWVFFDKKTALVVRVEQIIDKHRVISTYDDYQIVQGLTEPSHVHDTFGTPALDDDFRRQSLTFSASADDSQFTKPSPHETFLTIDRPSNIDARVVRGTVIVRMYVEGRGLDFELSSGDGHSYIDSGVAAELHLPTYGHVTEANGTSIAYETQIADAKIGDLHLQNFALEALPFYYHADVDTRVVGVLGYDFLSRGLFIVDYVNKRASASPITEASANQDMYTLPVRFDDGLPFFSSVIASHETKNVLLDSSFIFSYVFGSFSQAWPEAVVDTSNKQHQHTIVPFADNGSYGRDLDIWVANVPEIHIGPTHFFNYRIIATNAEIELGDRPIDAVMGTQFLAFYDVYYDFAHARVLLRQNDYFRSTFKPVNR